VDGYGGIEGAHLGGVGVKALVTASGDGGVEGLRWQRRGVSSAVASRGGGVAATSTEPSGGGRYVRVTAGALL
jgi:hypothetical protein